MANPEHLKVLKQGVEVWNKWREENREIRPDLKKADLSGTDLSSANFAGADLRNANFEGAVLAKAVLNGAELHETDFSMANLKKSDLTYAKLWKADFHGADLSKAMFNHANLTKAYLSNAILCRADFTASILSGTDLINSNLSYADFTRADLSNAILRKADMHEANLHEANLEGAILEKANLEKADLCRANLYRANFRKACARSANFQGAQLAKTIFKKTNLEGCYLYGSSAWELDLKKAVQTNLVITEKGERPEITVDSVEIAQFIYLLLNNEKIRHVIDTITSKVVLILGRFSKDRKQVLDHLRDVLRDRGLAPILFDFEKPASKDITGTVETLARMARFIVADLTDPSSIPHELATIVPFMRTTPIVPIRLNGSEGYSMFDDFEASYKWVLPKYEYENDQILIKSVSEKIILPAEAKVKELRGS